MNQGLLRWAFGSLALFQVLLISNTWGRWPTVAALCALTLVRTGLNILVPACAQRKGRQVLGLWVILGSNLLISTAVSQLLHWNLLAWFNLLFQAVFLNGFREREKVSPARLALGVYLAMSAVLAVREGIEPQTVGLFSIMACCFYGIGEARCQMLAAALDASHESHRRLQQMQAQLVAHEKLSSLGLLAAGVAHEINNPMAFVSSNVRALARELPTLHQHPETLREYVEDVLPETLDGIRRVNSIVADLRRFAREDPEKVTEFDLNSEVQCALRLSQGELKGHCQTEVALGVLPPIVGRPRQIGQVLVNLIVNAAQAVPDQDGMVRVSTHAEGDEVLVKVRDNGVGMPREVLDKLFQPFFTTKPVGEGTGLGLAVAYGIITGHGGHIDVESEPGKGSCFIVRLPRPQAEQLPAPAPLRATS